jgi:hypothetical protein
MVDIRGAQWTEPEATNGAVLAWSQDRSGRRERSCRHWQRDYNEVRRRSGLGGRTQAFIMAAVMLAASGSLLAPSAMTCSRP